MNTSTSSLPELTDLRRGLERALGLAGNPGGGVEIIERRPNIRATSLPSEFITCRLPDGRQLEIFCKYTGDDFDHCHGHRRTAGFEADVYQRLVNPLGVAAPLCYGGTGANWLFIEALSGASRLVESADHARAMCVAAIEIGRFHRLCEASQMPIAATFLRPYDRAFYIGWVRRTIEYAGPWHGASPWLATLGDKVEQMFDPLLASSQAVIHGELYPQNLLYRDGSVFIIDWQSTAIGPGEIDLAALTEFWPADIVEQCAHAYAEERWPLGEPMTFDATLRAAQLYLVFRWLGDRPEWTTSPHSERRFNRLRQLVQQLGLIDG